MLSSLLARVLGRRRRAIASPTPATPATPPGSAARSVAAAATAAGAGPPTLADMMRSLVEELGGPEAEVERAAWQGMADRVAKIAETMPPPPSFPRIATELLAMARDPEVDINDMVGLVQRDAAIASTLVRIANSAAFSPAVPVTSLRGAIQSLGVAKVVELALGTASRSYYDVTSTIELALFPDLWPGMFNAAMANAFSAGRLALDVPGTRGECALFAGLLADVGRPIALRILGGLVREGAPPPSNAIALATLDEVAAEIGARTIAGMALPDELRVACIPDPDRPTPDAEVARMIALIGAIQRRGPGMWICADDVRRRAERLRLGPYVVRALFAQRSQHVQEAAQMFAS